MPISVLLSYQIHHKNLRNLPTKEFQRKFYHYQDCLYPVILHRQTVQQQIQIITTNQIIKPHRPVALGKKHALEIYDQLALNTSCFWRST